MTLSQTALYQRISICETIICIKSNNFRFRL